MIAVRCFRTLRMAKRAGRGNVPEGIAGTRQGELVVDCPACPHDKKNLDVGWENKSPENKCVLSLILIFYVCGGSLALSC